MQLITRQDLDDLLALANATHRPGALRECADAGSAIHDHLARPAEAVTYLRARGLETPSHPPTTRELAELRELRDAVHRVADAEGVEPRAVAPVLDRGSFRISADGTLESTRPGWLGLADGLRSQLVELLRSRDRLERCTEPRCRWLFVDRSRNRSRRWCEMGLCGNRAKASRFRRRLRPDADPTEITTELGVDRDGERPRAVPGIAEARGPGRR